jgi:mxaA protein
MYYLLVLLWVLLPHLQAGTIVKRMEVSNPRPFGHVIGDTLQQRINLELATPYQLDEGSLPEAGSLSRWIEMRAPLVRTRHSQGTTSYEILLTYQTFYLAERLESIVIPSLELSVGNGERILPLLVPEWSFSVTPLAPRGTDAAATVSGLRSDHPPLTIPVTPHVYRIIGLSVCLLATLLYLAYACWGIPFLARRKRPFAVSLRQLKKLERKPYNDARYLDALRSLHRAFNLTTGWTVLAGNLELFFVHHPEFASLRSPIETLFMQSRMAFFEPRQELETDADSIQNLVQLCRRCRALERGIV